LEGWVYEGTLTERNYKKISTPVFCRIGKGFIEFRTEEGKNPPYKVLKLEEYEQVCNSHCKPSLFVSHAQKFVKNEDDNMSL
jgi:hypothetical protein